MLAQNKFRDSYLRSRTLLDLYDSDCELRNPQNLLQALGQGSYSEWCEQGQAASWLKPTCLPASNTCCLDLTHSCPHEARDVVLRSQHRYMHQFLQHQDEGCPYQLLKQDVLQPEITEISSKHPRPCCSSPNTAVCGMSEGVKKGVNLHVAQGNLEETQQKVVTPAVIFIMSLDRKRCPQGAELLWRCGLLCWG